jgi:hypothetical protein
MHYAFKMAQTERNKISDKQEVMCIGCSELRMELLQFSTTKEIENIIKSHKPKNSYGYDEISTKILNL